MKANSRKNLKFLALTVMLALVVLAATTPITANASTLLGFDLRGQGSVDFGSVSEGYTAPPAQTIEIYHNGATEIPITDIEVTLTGANAGSFALTSDADIVGMLDPVNPDAMVTATIQPVSGLPAGSYSADIEITGTANRDATLLPATVPVSFTVVAIPVATPGVTRSSDRSPSTVYDIKYFKNIQADETPWYIQGSYRSGETAYVTDRAPTRTGYRFLYWTSNSVDHGKHYDAGDKLTIFRDTVFYAQWELISDEPMDDAPIDLPTDTPANVNDNPGTGAPVFPAASAPADFRPAM